MVLSTGYEPSPPVPGATRIAEYALRLGLAIFGCILVEQC
jgi:hypothetical protein